MVDEFIPIFIPKSTHKYLRYPYLYPKVSINYADYSIIPAFSASRASFHLSLPGLQRFHNYMFLGIIEIKTLKLYVFEYNSALEV